MGGLTAGYTTEWLDLSLKNSKKWSYGIKLNTTLHSACSVKVSPEDVVIIEAEPMPILMMQYNLVTGAAKELPAPPTKVSPLSTDKSIFNTFTHLLTL